jgi:hypothetical protein
VTFEELLKIWEPYRGLTMPPVQTVTFWSAGGCGRFESESAAIAAYRDAGVEWVVYRLTGLPEELIMPKLDELARVVV